jgi:hypothetical protein
LRKKLAICSEIELNNGPHVQVDETTPLSCHEIWQILQTLVNLCRIYVSVKFIFEKLVNISKFEEKKRKKSAS